MTFIVRAKHEHDPAWFITKNREFVKDRRKAQRFDRKEDAIEVAQRVLDTNPKWKVSVEPWNKNLAKLVAKQKRVTS